MENMSLGPGGTWVIPCEVGLLTANTPTRVNPSNNQISTPPGDIMSAMWLHHTPTSLLTIYQQSINNLNPSYNILTRECDDEDEAKLRKIQLMNPARNNQTNKIRLHTHHSQLCDVVYNM